MPKRKAPPETATDISSPQRRRTRSTGPLVDTQPLESPNKKRHGTRSSPTKQTSKGDSARTRTVIRAHETSSLKENDAEDLECADEPNISPSKSHLSRSSTPHRVGSAEAVTPKRRSSRKLHRDPNSQTPAKGRNDGVNDNDAWDLPVTPSKKRIAVASPSKIAILTTQSTTLTHIALAETSTMLPQRLPTILPAHLHTCLNAQKRAILAALRHPPDFGTDRREDDDMPSANSIVSQELSDLLLGTVSRGEGNSCLLLGPRGSGKTHLVEQVITDLPEQAIVIRLSGWAQHNDRLAMREIARQLNQQTGDSFMKDEDDLSAEEEDGNPFQDTDRTITLPPPSHLPALISVLPTLSRPTIVVLDGFDLFALHARQSLLYCLLDTVQSCRAGNGNKGVAVVGVTPRIDTVNLLEKRVKSRFSGRMLRTAGPPELLNCMGVIKKILTSAIDSEHQLEWSQMWSTSVDKFLEDVNVIKSFSETFALMKDVQLLSQVMTQPVLELFPSSPFLLASQVTTSVAVQRCRARFHFLDAMPYSFMCLLIAAEHAQVAGHDAFSFEMLHETFRDQVRASMSAPVQVDGGGIGMVKCSREVLMRAFEQLVSSKVFVPTTAPSVTIASEFVRYRSHVPREDVKKAIETIGQISLKKWFSKAQ